MFTFVLAISEVNAFLALRYFTFAKGTIAGCPTLIVFRRRLAWQLISNSWIAAEETAAGLEVEKPYLAEFIKLGVWGPIFFDGT